MVTHRPIQHSQLSALMGFGIGLLLIAALIHLGLAPHDLQRHAGRGLLMAASGVLGLLAAVGIYRGSKLWGWGLGLIVSGGALVFFIISRVTGFPQQYPLWAWTEPIEILMFIVEIGFIMVTLRVLQPREPLE